MSACCYYTLRVVGNQRGCKKVIKELKENDWDGNGLSMDIEKLIDGYEISGMIGSSYFDFVVECITALTSEYSLECEIYMENIDYEVFEHYLIKKGVQLSYTQNLFIHCIDEEEFENELEWRTYLTKEDFKEEDGIYDYGNDYKDFVIGTRKEN